MAYVVAVDPGAIDSPDVLAYQPHVYDRLDPPALIPLQMREVDLRIDITIERAEVTLRARWWVHCVTRSHVEQHLLCTCPSRRRFSKLVATCPSASVVAERAPSSSC
jgi:hypothetical protein